MRFSEQPVFLCLQAQAMDLMVYHKHDRLELGFRPRAEALLALAGMPALSPGQRCQDGRSGTQNRDVQSSYATVMLPAIVIPLWGKLVLFGVAKKLTVLLAARIYGFPRLYRKSQHTIRHVAVETIRICLASRPD